MPGVRWVAAAQTVPVAGDLDANLADHVRFVRAAADEGMRLLVFPELSLTGYELDRAADLSFSQTDPRLDSLRALASANSLALVVGAPVRVEGQLHIGAFLLKPDRTVSLYTKQRLGAFPADANPDGPVPPAEDTVFRPGDHDPLLELDGHTAAVAVCADTGDAEHPERAAARGADTYIASMFFTPRELDEESARLQGYAERHAMAVVLANYGGPTGGLPAAGGSAVWSPDGQRVVQAERAGPALVVAREHDDGSWRGHVAPVEG